VPQAVGLLPISESTPNGKEVKRRMAEEMGAMPGDEVTDDDKLWALLSYIFCPLIGIIVLLLEDRKNRPFIKYNAWVSIILGVLMIILSSCCIGILVWFYALYLGIKSYGGEWVEVPVISDFVRNQGWA
jgi:uncharacterized membrane protein